MAPLISFFFSPSLCLYFLLCCLWLTVCTVEVRWRAFRPIQLAQAWGLNNTQSPVTLHRLQLSTRWLVQLSVIPQYKYKHTSSVLFHCLASFCIYSTFSSFFFFFIFIFTHMHKNSAIFSPYPMSWGEVCYFPILHNQAHFFTWQTIKPIYFSIELFWHLSTKQPPKKHPNLISVP